MLTLAMNYITQEPSISSSKMMNLNRSILSPNKTVPSVKPFNTFEYTLESKKKLKFEKKLSNFKFETSILSILEERN